MGTEIEVVTNQLLQPFQAEMGRTFLVQRDASLYVGSEIGVLREPIISLPAGGLREVTFALLNCPFPTADPKNYPTSEKVIRFPCAQFEVVLEAPSAKHLEITEKLGNSPNALTHSGLIRHRAGQEFSSGSAEMVLDTVHDVLSFAAGKWIGVALVEGLDAASGRKWFRWGKTRLNGILYTPSRFDADHPQWLVGVCDGMLQLSVVCR